MKRYALSLAGIVSLMMLVSVVYAQTIRVRVDVPFAFAVNGRTMPVGSYHVDSFGAMDGRTLMISNQQTGDRLVVRANASQILRPAEKTKLVFHRYGDSYFLANIWVAGNDLGHELPKSAREKELAQNHPMESVTVLAQLH